MGRAKPGVRARERRSGAERESERGGARDHAGEKENQIPQIAAARREPRDRIHMRKSFGKPIYVLMALAGLVLLLACANLANLLLARAGARQRETSTRLALGAGRGRILRQMMTESLLLSLMGGAGGLLLAWAVRNAIPRMLSNAWAPPAFAAKFELADFLFAVAMSIVTGIIFGLAPAWQADARAGECESEGQRTDD